MNSEWVWQASPISLPFPQSGRVGVNHQEPSQATVLYVHKLDTGNVDRGATFERLTRHDTIYLQTKTNATSWHRYEVTGRANLQEECWLIPVKTTTGSPHGTEPSNQTPILLSIPGDP